jgi:hypothetical protein
LVRLQGRISEDLWRIDAKLYFNGKTYPDTIEFLIDSGAQATILSSSDAKTLKIKFDDLEGSKEIEIIGYGKCPARQLFNAGIVFSSEDDEDLLEPSPKIYLADGQNNHSGYSVIGQDILSRYNVVANNKTKKVYLILITNSYISIPRQQTLQEN